MNRLLPLVALVGCDPYDPCASSDLGPPDGLVLTESHPGWGRDQCFECHVRARIHDEACVPGVNLDALATADLEPCTRCHGDNRAGGDTGGSR